MGTSGSVDKFVDIIQLYRESGKVFSSVVFYPISKTLSTFTTLDSHHKTDLIICNKCIEFIQHIVQGTWDVKALVVDWAVRMFATVCKKSVNK